MEPQHSATEQGVELQHSATEQRARTSAPSGCRIESKLKKQKEFLSSSIVEKSLLEVPGIGLQTVKKFRTNEDVDVVFGGRVSSAEDLYKRYQDGEQLFVRKLRAIGITETNIDRIVDTFSKVSIS